MPEMQRRLRRQSYANFQRAAMMRVQRRAPGSPNASVQRRRSGGGYRRVEHDYHAREGLKALRNGQDLGGQKHCTNKNNREPSSNAHGEPPFEIFVQGPG